MLHSFRLRIGLLSVAISALLFTGFGFYAAMVLNRVGIERIDRELRALTDTHIRRVHPEEHWARFDKSLRTIYGSDAAKQFILKVTTLDDHVLYVSTNWPSSVPSDALPLALIHVSETSLDDIEQGVPMPPLHRAGRRPPPRHRDGRPPPREPQAVNMHIRGPVYETIGIEDHSWRAMTIANERMKLSIAMSLDTLHAETSGFSHALIIAVPIALLIIIAGGWLIAHMALKPVKRIACTVETVTAHRLDQRIAVKQADTEFVHLIQLINGMLERLERSFLQASRFSADAAHELKTPLAILQAHIEQSLQAAPDGSSEQTEQASQLEEVQRLKTILSKLLLLSQADSGRLPLSLEHVNLAELGRAAAEDAQMLAPNRTTHVNSPAELIVEGDKDLLNQVIQNLISNAVKFGDQEGTIEVVVTSEVDRAILSVSNTGNSIPNEVREKIFDRFYRADKAHSREVEGYGLGLSLAREIMRAHNGNLVLARSDAEKTIFCMIFPR